jgi:hypothetical protein
MVSAIEFAVRTGAGGNQHGFVSGDGQSNFIQVGSGDSVSLNLSQSSVVAYERQGGDLVIKLIDGRSIVLADYFEPAPGAMNHLYLSSDGNITEVMLSDSGDGLVYANYGPASGWDKWSPLDDLRFTSGDNVAMATTAASEPAGMAPIVPGLLGLGGGLGTAAAVAGGAAIIGGGGGGGSNGGRKPPTVDDQAKTTVTTNTDDGSLHVSGTGEPGDSVSVKIGDKTETTTIGTDGKWAVTFPETGLPADGSYQAEVTVNTTTGQTISLTGPDFVIDLTPPAVSVEHGTKSVGEVENLAAYQDGVTISGKGEAGATVTVVIGGVTKTTTISSSGSWSVNFSQSQVAGGEYEVPVTITATDPLGNTTTLHETLVVDTVPHPITFDSVTSDNTVNFTENAAGVTVTGSSTAGATLTLTLQGVTRTVTVGSDGKWTATWPGGTLPAGEYTASLTATTTDTAGNVTTATKSFQVDTQTSVAFSGQVAGDNIVNAAETAGSVVLTGTAQPGATVSVAWNGSTLPATVAADGSWSVSFPGSSIAGGTYSSTATVTATDAAGNTATATRSIQVDTQTSVAVNAGQAGGDNILSGAERAAGLTLTGTGEAGATVRVTFEGVTKTVTVAQNGSWTANWTTTEVPAGTYNSTVQVSATDIAGNTATTSHTLAIDTQVSPFTRVSLSTGADNVLNAAEAVSGLTVTGTVEPGSTVMVKFGSGASRAATVAADGSWSITIPPGDIPAGESLVTMTATATDRVGNTATLTEQVKVDTTVLNFASTTGAIGGGDHIMNAEDVAAGLTMGGTAEVGSTIVVHLGNGSTHTVTVGSSGTWTTTFTSAELPSGEVTTSATVTATDKAGNTSTYTESFDIDTVGPQNPWVTNDAGTGNLISGIATSAQPGDLDYFTVDASGHVTELQPLTTFNANVTVDGNAVPSEWAFFQNPIQDGTYLVIRDQDAAGNEASTLYIRNTTGEITVDLNRAGLETFDFGTIDLTAADANLTLSEAQINRLGGVDRQLTVAGNSDDALTLTGGADTGTTQTINGETYKLYLVGTHGASVLVDDDISVTLTAV